MQPEHNFNKAANFIRSAAQQGAELVVLPEYHLTNWLPKDPGFVGLCDRWETYLRKYRDLAKECGICIVPGTIVESHRNAEKDEDKLLNVCYFIDHQGNIAGKYIKKNLWYVRHSSRLIKRCGRCTAVEACALRELGAFCVHAKLTDDHDSGVYNFAALMNVSLTVRLTGDPSVNISLGQGAMCMKSLILLLARLAY